MLDGSALGPTPFAGENPHSLVLINNCDVRATGLTEPLRPGPARRSDVAERAAVENVAMPRHEPRQRRLVHECRRRQGGARYCARAASTGASLRTRDWPRRAAFSHPCVPHDRRGAGQRRGAGRQGAEYLDSSGRMTVVTADDFAPYRQALAPLLNWAAANENLFRDAQPDAEVAVYYDIDGMATRWTATAPATFAVADGPGRSRGAIPLRGDSGRCARRFFAAPRARAAGHPRARMEPAAWATAHAHSCGDSGHPRHVLPAARAAAHALVVERTNDLAGRAPISAVPLCAGSSTAPAWPPISYRVRSSAFRARAA